MYRILSNVCSLLQGPLAADADDPAVVDSEDEMKHKLEAQAARHHDTLDIFAEQVGHLPPVPSSTREYDPASTYSLHTCISIC